MAYRHIKLLLHCTPQASESALSTSPRVHRKGQVSALVLARVKSTEETRVGSTTEFLFSLANYYP